MIGESVPDTHKQAIAQLSAQIDHYLATGNRIQDVPAGVSKDSPFHGTSNHSTRLKDRRAKRAPDVRKLAAAGMSARDIGKKLGLDTRTVALTAKEHGITFKTAN